MCSPQSEPSCSVFGLIDLLMRLLTLYDSLLQVGSHVRVQVKFIHVAFHHSLCSTGMG